ncbi:hypothetical protein ACM0P6_01245 [Komagataeibacter sucrofermentans]|uniref:Uncharacterized protein n=1 Tax=Komagataeibacter sucrofermentans TaxID=1053551 RepID=A0A318QYT2_9PROT|nr:hypothetical protein [Komagataeibacter sucrofermentans]PYD80489.1 hypothetical protein CFR77_03635 [Komagataeibacter sucrofermentans]GBQ47757.1 hypothetical protein AA15973_1293 [Komagataeibacter sucrofermentans DSM 15973]
MSAAETLRKLSPEDVQEIAKQLEGTLHQHKTDLHKQIAEHLASLKGEVTLHENKIPTSCKVYGMMFLLAAALASFIFGRKSAE